MSREMICVKVFYNGKVVVEDIASDYATQHLYCFSQFDGDGCCYHCKKDMKDFYLKKLVKEAQAHIDNQIAELEQKKVALQSLADNINAKEETV